MAGSALAAKLLTARNMVCCAEIAAGDLKRLEAEQQFPVTETLRVALDMIDDILEAMGRDAGDAD